MITLNGGKFGGVSVKAIEAVDPIFVIKDENKDQWVYDSSRHPKSKTADFIGMIDDVPQAKISKNVYSLTV